MQGCARDSRRQRSGKPVGHHALPAAREGSELSPWQHEYSTVHKRVRARVEHAFAHMKWWNTLRNCRRKRDGVHHATRGIALMSQFRRP